MGVYADVNISNQMDLLAGGCWIIRGFFFATYRRTSVDVSVFTSDDGSKLLVEVQRMQGDHGACHKLCEYLQRHCRLSVYTDTDGFGPHDTNDATPSHKS